MPAGFRQQRADERLRFDPAAVGRPQRCCGAHLGLATADEIRVDDLEAAHAVSRAAFEQRFESPQRAYAIISLDVAVEPLLRGGVARRHHVTVRRATRPNVEGAIDTLGKVANEAATRILAWAAEPVAAATADRRLTPAK